MSGVQLFMMERGHPGGKASASIPEDLLVHNGAAIDALPGVERKKVVGQSLQKHEALTFWTIHRVVSLFG
jgi:hypothetical protein